MSLVREHDIGLGFHIRSQLFNLADKFMGTAYSDEETILRMVTEFDNKTKRLFRDSARQSFIPFGTPRDHDPANDIRGGQLVVKG